MELPRQCVRRSHRLPPTRAGGIHRRLADLRPAATFLYDVAGFSAKWLRDLAADQWPDGRIPNWAPEPGHGRRPEDTYAFINGSAGWGGAAVIVPWQMYLAYGDTRVLADQFDCMVRWVDYGARIAREQRFHERASARPVAAPHEAYIWDSGFHWGEWSEPRRATTRRSTFRTTARSRPRTSTGPPIC
ncbi:hypothetical protein GCM10023205_73260 [Yinghuangia aomiensis]|uniref:alpha-L-rhamnosidase n=1 Tax=Yinghuangia aomiensis TaxID=676205 RepID=A0ABP9I920_9ACTN